MRSRNAWQAAASLAAAAALLGGCGGEASTGERLARLADDVAEAVAAGDGCEADAAARKLQRAVIEAVNRRELPAGELEQTLGDVNELEAGLRCGSRPTARSGSLARSLAERFRRL